MLKAQESALSRIKALFPEAQVIINKPFETIARSKEPSCVTFGKPCYHRDWVTVPAGLYPVSLDGTIYDGEKILSVSPISAYGQENIGNAVIVKE